VICELQTVASADFRHVAFETVIGGIGRWAGEVLTGGRWLMTLQTDGSVRLPGSWCLGVGTVTAEAVKTSFPTSTRLLCPVGLHQETAALNETDRCESCECRVIGG
jgi:hypothetical protein